jgi:hypothetical protein
MSTSQKQEWVALYEEALLESEEKPFLVRALLAKRAMVDRLRDFGVTGKQPPERNDLLRAVINLRTVETEIRNPKRSNSQLENLKPANHLRAATVHDILETDRSIPDDRWKRLWIVARH